jgi:basic membrane lipoprotein Med (substrate-binding protein (PBP1-ABC) superfamily)
VISSAVKHVDHVVGLFLQHLQRGDFQSGKQIFSLRDDATGFSTPSSVVPQAIINQVIDVRTKIHNGEITPTDTIPPGL